MKKLIFISIIFLLRETTYSQINLVPNAGFEALDSCPQFGDQILYSTGWYKASEINSTPDYYNSCSPSNEMGVPRNFLFYQDDVRSCGAYAAVVTWFYAGNDREQIGIQLSQPLIIGQKYFLSFITVMGGTSDGFYYFDTPSNNIGMRLSTVQYSASNPAPIDNFAHLRSISVISDTLNWVRISGSIIADSAYNYLMLGNFYDNANTDTSTTICANCTNSYGYYLLDNICVSTDSVFCNGGIDLLSCSVSVSEQNLRNYFSLFPNPTSNLVYLKNTLQTSFDIIIYDSFGQAVFQKKNVFSHNFPIDLSSYANGLYFIDISTKANKLNYKLVKH